MQEKESINYNDCSVQILEITVRHHQACLVMPNSYSRDRMFRLQTSL